MDCENYRLGISGRLDGESVERILAVHWPDADEGSIAGAARMVVLVGDGLLREVFRGTCQRSDIRPLPSTIGTDQQPVAGGVKAFPVEGIGRESHGSVRHWVSR